MSEPKWNSYESRPIIRKAICIKKEHQWWPLTSTEAILVVGGEHVPFKYFQDVKVGDYVVQASAEDTYHCNKKLFEERNYV